MGWIVSVVSAVGMIIAYNQYSKNKTTDLKIEQFKQVEVLEQRLREMSRVSEPVEVRTERYVPWIVKVLAWAGGIALLYAVGKTMLRIAVRALQK